MLVFIICNKVVWLTILRTKSGHDEKCSSFEIRQIILCCDSCSELCHISLDCNLLVLLFVFFLEFLIVSSSSQTEETICFFTIVPRHSSFLIVLLDILIYTDFFLVLSSCSHLTISIYSTHGFITSVYFGGLHSYFNLLKFFF